MENPDDQTRRLLQDEQAYSEQPEDIRRLADAIWSGISDQLDTQAGSTLPASTQPADTQPAETLSTQPAETLSMPPAPAPPAPTPHRLHRVSWLVAASLTGLFVAGILWLDHHGSKPVPAAAAPMVANFLIRQDSDRVNQTDRSQTVYLVDGSKVILQPGAGIRHAAFLQKDKREVYLQGNAFFDVAKDARRPFYVYSGDVVVRVLGTSFKVATDKDNGDITVLVTTGKVAVTKKTAPLPEPLILTTNQIAFYKGQSRNLIQLKAEKKDLAPDLIPAAPAISFNFEETPVTEIFQTLENAYGIPFHYDKAAFSRSVLTTTFSDEPLEQKITIICEAINATYQLKEDGIFIDAKPRK